MTRSQSCFRTLACSAVVLVAGAVSAPRARACETATSARPDSECVVLDRQGAKGVWFQLALANQLRTSHQLVSELRLQAEKYSELDKKRTEEVEALRGALTLRQVAGEQLKAELELQTKEARAATEEAIAAREDLDRWWRSPIVWLAVGALGGALAGIAIAH
jgi:hypothetical protein